MNFSVIILVFLNAEFGIFLITTNMEEGSISQA